MSPSVPEQFTCAHCGAAVPFMDSGLLTYEYRNQCPVCQWSQHLLFGTSKTPPCGGMMPPVKADLVSPLLFAQQCEDCQFIWVSYDEDWWAGLSPQRQSVMINLACTETERLNLRRLRIYRARPGLGVPPPPAVEEPGGRPRVKHRP